MYLMYVDESGDNGKSGSSYLILCGLVIRAEQWNDFLEQLKNFRRTLKNNHHFLVTYELHARELLRGSKFLLEKGLHLDTRINIYQETMGFLSKQEDYLGMMAVSIDKSKNWSSPITYVEKAWQLLIQRFENFLEKNNSYGIIIGDVGYQRLARRVYRKMRIYNPIPSKRENMDYYYKPIRFVLEDPNWRDSKDSFILQLVDIICNAVKEKEIPSKKAKRKNYYDFFKFLKPITMPEISKTKDGIVHYP